MAQMTDWRAALYRTSADLRRVMAEDAGAPGWSERVHRDLGEVDAALGAFEAEIADGFYDDVIADAPRLAPSVHKLRVEQAHLRTLLDRTMEMADSRVEVGELRVTLLHLARRLDAHNHRAFGIVFDAYDTDLGGQG